MKRMLRGIGAAVCMAGAGAGVAAAGHAGVSHCDERAGGCGELGAAWWQWAYSIEAVHNPLTDDEGARCDVGQRGDVWFLGGAWGEPRSVTRKCRVPSRVALFFPVLNVLSNNEGERLLRAEDGLRDECRRGLEGSRDLRVELDGAPIGERALVRAQTPPFSYVTPEDSLDGRRANGGGPRTVFPAVSEGYWGFVPALAPGRHVLHFAGAVEDYFVDATYELTVE